MNIFAKALVTLCGSAALVGCVSMADYQVALASDGSFAAFDKQFSVNPLDYPVFMLVSDHPRQDPEVGAYKGPLEWTTDILPSDRWEITRLVNGRYLAYSREYGVRYCKRQMTMRKSLIPRCDTDGQKYADYYIYAYIRRDGSVYGWQYAHNRDRALFEKTWFKVSNKGDWSGQPWFKCVDRCGKLSNMK